MPTSHLSSLPRLALVAGVVSVLFTGAIFGFFYSWVCSTMWGLDAIDPRVAMAAMQAMNASVRNWVFLPIFGFTPLVLTISGVTAVVAGRRPAALSFFAAAVLYTAGALLLTTWVNVPMNETLGATPVPSSVEEAARIWQAYSGRWQMFNLVRTVVSGLSLLLTTTGLVLLTRPRSAPAPATTTTATPLPLPA